MKAPKNIQGASKRLSLAGMLVAAALAGAAGPVYGEGREGHGGQTVELNGRPVLRDFIAKNTWRVYEGKEFADTLSRFPKVLKSIEDVHWYFARKYREEVQSVRVFLTEADLVEISVDDLDALTVFEFNGSQVAIRVGDDIYVDEKIFRRMDDENQAYLLTHELMHGFIPSHVSQRNMKVRSMVAAIRENEKTPIGARRFATAMEANSLTVISSSATLDPVRKHVAFLDDPTVSDERKELEMAKLELKDPKARELISRYFRFYLFNSELVRVVQEALKQSNTKTIAELFASGLDPNFKVPSGERVSDSYSHDPYAERDEYAGERSLLTQAIFESSDEMVALLLKQKGVQATPSVNAAIRRNRESVFKALLRHPSIDKAAMQELFCETVSQFIGQYSHYVGQMSSQKIIEILLGVSWMDPNASCPDANGRNFSWYRRGEHANPLINLIDATGVHFNGKIRKDLYEMVETFVRNPRVNVNAGPSAQSESSDPDSAETSINPFSLSLFQSWSSREGGARVARAFLARKDFNPNLHADALNKELATKLFSIGGAGYTLDISDPVRKVNPLAAAAAVAVRPEPNYVPLQLLLQDSRVDARLITYLREILEVRRKEIDRGFRKDYDGAIQILKQAEKARKARR